MKPKNVSFLSLTLLGALLLSVLVAAFSVRPVLAQDIEPPREADPGLRKPSPRLRNPLWPFRGDRPVTHGLVLVTAETTGLTGREVLAGLREGQSIAQIAEANGSGRDAILASFNAHIQTWFDKAVENGRLPESLAQGRVAWFKDVARKMVDLPGFRPAYPGLHELHVFIISGAVRVSELDRQQVREELKSCQTLDEILTANGHSGQEAVAWAMERIAQGLDKLVEAGRLSAETADSWAVDIEAALERMTLTPGLHVAGKECAN